MARPTSTDRRKAGNSSAYTLKLVILGADVQVLTQSDNSNSKLFQQTSVHLVRDNEPVFKIITNNGPNVPAFTLQKYNYSMKIN
jgi:hypothetical protein